MRYVAYIAVLTACLVLFVGMSHAVTVATDTCKGQKVFGMGANPKIRLRCVGSCDTGSCRPKEFAKPKGKPIVFACFCENPIAPNGCLLLFQRDTNGQVLADCIDTGGCSFPCVPPEQEGDPFPEPGVGLIEECKCPTSP